MGTGGVSPRKSYRVGSIDIVIAGAESLVGVADGVTRLPSPGGVPLARLFVDTSAERDWPLEVSEHDDAHVFGRDRHRLEVYPETMDVRLTLTRQLGADAVCWLRRDLFGLLACLSGELMLHGSSVIRDGEAHVFCGHSGAGKSALCRMLSAQGLEAVSDEINWLFRDKEGVLRMVNQLFWIPDPTASATLARSGDPCPPVSKVCLLRQSPACALKAPLHPATTFSELLACHLGIDERHGFIRKRAEALAKLVETVDIPVFEFNLNPSEVMRTLFG